MTVRTFVDTLFIPAGICPYCGCSRASHDRRLRQTSEGSKVYVQCLDCSTRMETRQVVCVAEPGVYR